ncbi:MAG TPA: SMC family ATPase [Ktedonobacterales bacterium]|nr:SMC family ATPase [Ktedonobacterales bacterium]
MRVVRVELKNIKSYRDAVIDLQAGVTAIRGHNGAGKSTLLEAIGWALFNTLPYNQESFVREGERSGKVTIRFVDAKDNREYEVVRRCGSGATWYVLDPETGLRIDSTADVIAFLRDHLRIDGSVALGDLFTSAIGVPQGSLTADFLMTPANRKKRFDALLQVEDYGAAAVKLNDTVNYLKQRRAVQETEIQGLERDVALLEEARARLEEARARARALEVERDQQEREAATIEARREALLLAQTEVARREGAAQTAAARLLSARQRTERAAALLTEARAATEAVEAARADHERYLHAERERAAASERQRARDALRQREADATRRLAAAEADRRNAAQRLTEVERAERQILALQSDAVRQVKLERARDEARQNAQRLREAIQAGVKVADALTRLEQTIAGREREVAGIEAAQAEAAALPERQRQVDALQAAAATRQQHERRLAAIAEERKRNASQREKATADITRQQTNVTKLQAVRPLVERLPELEKAELAAQEALAAAEARLAQTRRSREQAGEGNCPFLAEPCLNIQRRGENNLRDWFDKRIAVEECDLAPLRAAQEAARAEANDARAKAPYYNQLSEFQERLKQARAALDECDETRKRLDAEEAEIAAELKRAGDAASLTEALRLLKVSQEADRSMAKLDGLGRELDDMRERQARETEERDRLRALARELASAPDALKSAEAALAQLGDPRGRIAGLQTRAAERAATERALAAAAETLTRLEAERAGITEALKPYVALDAEITALETDIQRTRAGHASYMRNEQAASQLPTRAAEQRAAVVDEARMAKDEAAARSALDAARARFDADELARVSARANELSHARGQTREVIRTLGEMIAGLEEALRRGQEQVATLEAARAERDELAAMEKTLQQFREFIKDAGPQVTRALLSQISAQANAIFGDIIGDRAGKLAWENDYEITLRRDGAIRTFAQLSGGEQMSAALAVRLALLRRLTRLDMAFFDEPTQNMDGERRSALAEQLRRVRGFEQLIVISHDDTFEQGLDGVIHLEKRDGATRVAEGEAVFASASPLAG